jgi:hypothetical protein
MTKKEWPYRVCAKVHQLKFKEMLVWLHESGHVLHTTVKFGKQFRQKDDPIVKQEVGFKDADQAMLFKLAWG